MNEDMTFWIPLFLVLVLTAILIEIILARTLIVSYDYGTCEQYVP